MSNDKSILRRTSEQNEMEEGQVIAQTTIEIDQMDAKHWNKLGLSHYQEFQRGGQLDNINKAIGYVARAIDMTPNGDPYLPTPLGNLGTMYLSRFERLGKLDDIELAITFISRALASTPEGHLDLPLWLSNLGQSYSKRFERLGALDDLHKAMKYRDEAVNLTPDDHPALPIRLTNRGMSYRARFLRLGELGDIEQAIVHLSRAVTLATTEHSSLPIMLNNLGSCYSGRFDCLGMVDDLHKAIEYKTRAVSLTPDNHPDLPMRLSNLGLSFRTRFLRLGELNDVENAIAHLSRAVALTPQDHPNTPLFINNLGQSYSNRFDRLGTLIDLHNAMEYQTRSVNLTPDDHPDLPMRLSNLALSYRTRFMRLGELEDIEQAIVHLSRAVTLTPLDHSDLALWLSNLGLCYSSRFDRIGTVSNLDQAIEYEARAVNITLESHADLAKWLSNLGLSYSKRFDCLGMLDDLYKAIEHETRAVNLTSDSHPDLPMRLSNLGLSYRDMFLRQGKLGDIEQAIAHLCRAVTLAPIDHSNRALWLSNLGLCYSTRFRCLGMADDLHKEIDHKTRAVELTPDDHSDLPMRLSNLGLSYRARFLQIGELNDIENAITHLSRAIALTPDKHPILTTFYWNLAATILSQYQQTNDPTHLQHSSNYYCKGSQLSTGSPRDRFRCALDWAALASMHSSLDCIEAYQTTMDLLPQFIWLGAPKVQRYYDLTAARSLAIDAAAAAIRYADPASALEWLEQARCVVWSQSLMLDSPLDQLHLCHPALASRLKSVAKQLQRDSADASGSSTSMAVPESQEQVGRDRRRIAQEYENLLAEARSFPGFESFLRPMRAGSLIHACRYGPVVLINCHERCCDALIILPGNDGIKHLPLPQYNQAKARNARSELEKSLRRKGLRQRGVKSRLPLDHKDGFSIMLLDLWTYVVKPILDFLGFTSAISGRIPPHITWCPTGPMTLLPLHAAGDYEKTQSCIFDYAISSYTPTLSALLRCSPSQLTCASRLLLIGQTNTPGHSPLPGTAEELECVKKHAQGRVEYTQLVGCQATIATALDSMEQHDWVHLACHAHQNLKKPTESGFYLHDGTLDLTAINQKSFKNKGLAYLSACQTATGDEKLPDEAIHLASGMLMAGYSSVIATMWSVKDVDAPLVADKVYTELMEGGRIGNGEAGKALHYAVTALREKVGAKEFERWVPYIHIGA